MPILPNFEILSGLDLKRVSIVNFIIDKMYQQFQGTTKTVLDKYQFNTNFKC